MLTFGAIKKIKIVENDATCGEIIIFDHKFYLKETPKLSHKFCLGGESFVKKHFPGGQGC